MTRVKVPTRIQSFHLHGSLHRPAVMTVADLAANWEQHRAEVTFDCATSGPQRHVFDGPLLRDVVAAAGPTFESRRRKDRSRYMLAVHGGDGHHTVLSWAEIDPDFGDAPVLLATAMDGRPLDARGTQLVVPSDRCGARYVSAVTDVWIGAYGPLGRPMSEPQLLFSYGTLRQAGVQRACFGRELSGRPDALPGFRLDSVAITDPSVVADSGSDEHPVAVHTGDPGDVVLGTVFTLTAAELAAADAYEVGEYTRMRFELRSGAQAWVYVESAARRQDA